MKIFILGLSWLVVFSVMAGDKIETFKIETIVSSLSDLPPHMNNAQSIDGERVYYKQQFSVGGTIQLRNNQIVKNNIKLSIFGEDLTPNNMTTKDIAFKSSVCNQRSCGFLERNYVNARDKDSYFEFESRLDDIAMDEVSNTAFEYYAKYSPDRVNLKLAGYCNEINDTQRRCQLMETNSGLAFPDASFAYHRMKNAEIIMTLVDEK